MKLKTKIMMLKGEDIEKKVKGQNTDNMEFKINESTKFKMQSPA